MTADPLTPGQAVVQITLGQVYNEVTGTRREVTALAEAVKSSLAIGADHETRIRTLERRMWMAIGMGTVASGVAGYALTLYTSAH
jgi:hypothetical protein